jgi:general secretion pathway protein D
LESTTDFRPTTLKRTVETTVMVKDGSTVVIGGLIDDTFSQTEYKVPCLGDVPGLGWLFKTRSKGSEKSNLFIFITPRVIQNPGEAASVSESKKTDHRRIARDADQAVPGRRRRSGPATGSNRPSTRPPDG